MTQQWIAAYPRTGIVIADVPGFVPDWPLKRTLCKYETGTGHLYLDGAPPNWPTAMRAGASIMACYDDADPGQTIQWAGLITEADSDGATDQVDVSMVTAEGYLDRVFVGDEQFTSVSQFTIASTLVLNYGTEQPGRPGLPFQIQLENAGSPALLTYTYFDSDNASVYKRLTDLAGLDTPTEFIVDWEWNDAHTAIFPVMRLGSRLGSAPLTPSPAASFNMPGPVQSAKLVQTYADGKGANLVRTYSSGSAGPATGDDQGSQLVSDKVSPDSYLTDDLPTFEYRWTPSESIVDVNTLDSYAQQGVNILAPGQASVTLVADLSDSTRHGGLWVIGDDVGYRIGADDTAVPAFPNGGLVGTGRAISYEVGETTISPILAVTTVGNGT